MGEDSKSLHEKLAASNISFRNKLRLAVEEGELDYWWGRGNPPNESPEVFRLFIKKFKGEITPKWVARESMKGNNALLGEDNCFKFEHDICLFGFKKRFFIKGYFFDKGNLRGVTIQSFREIAKLTIA